MTIFEEIKESFKKGSSLTRLIYVNLAVFLIVKITQVILFLFNADPLSYSLVIRNLAVPAEFPALIRKPWTIITYMFLHDGFLHILFNILWLYWFGRIFLEYLDGKKLVGVYLLGGFSGALFYMIAFNFLPAFENILSSSIALGASASVLAIVIAISVYVPNYTIYLLFLGPVKLKYIALVTILIDIISIAGSNAGGHIAHLGGALFGWYYIQRYRRGKDITKGINSILDAFFTWLKPRRNIKVTYKRTPSDHEFNRQRVQNQEVIDKILEKISRSGYDSLTKEEKELLFRQGQ